MVLISAVIGLLVGPLADHYGYRWPLVCGLLAITVTLLGASLAPNYAVLLAVSIAGGLGDALAFALPLAIARTFFTGDARQRAIGLTIASLSSAPIIGAPVLTAISSVSSWRVALGTAALLPYLGAFLGSVIGLGTGQIGLVYALTGGAKAASSVITGRFGRLSTRPAIGIASVAAGLLLVPLLAVGQASVALPLLIIVAVAAAVSGVSVPALLAVESPAGAGTTMVLNGSALNLGSAGGAAMGGLLIGIGGYAVLGAGLLVVALASATLACWPQGRR